MLKASSSGLADSKVTGAIFVPRVLFVNARRYHGPLRDTH